MSNENEKSILLCILSFLIPIVGWVLFFVKKKENPEVASSYGMWGTVGFIVNLVMQFIL